MAWFILWMLAGLAIFQFLTGHVSWFERVLILIYGPFIWILIIMMLAWNVARHSALNLHGRPKL
jgi:hypothetical protein